MKERASEIDREARVHFCNQTIGLQGGLLLEQDVGERERETLMEKHKRANQLKL